jgi:DNA invertase Pin-like site-specific DNA recombinase
MESGVEFVAVDNPHANKLTVHILAAVAQHEREMISERTKAALKAARARGTRLGNPRLDEAAKRGTAALKANASRFAANVLPIIREIEKAGAASLNAIAAKLNERNVPTARGGRWTHVQVGAVLRPFADGISPLDRGPAIAARPARTLARTARADNSRSPSQEGRRG